MSADLPAGLKAAIARLLEGRPRRAISERAARMSQGYRAGASSQHAIESEDDVLAYLVARMPATYAAIAAALSETVLRAPDFAPRSLLDAGAGPGTASWAAAEIFPGLANIAMIDGNARFCAMAGQLAAGSAHAALTHAQARIGDIVRSEPPLPPSDLVIAGYVLAELGGDDAARLVSRLWRATAGVLVLVEPGTPDGYRRVVAARTHLIANGGRLVAPCPHDKACPIEAPDWCHFAIRLSRSRDHMIAKSANVPFEDEKFSYLVVAREDVAVAPAKARVLAPPRRTKAAITMKLCVDGRIEMRQVARRDRTAFAEHRNIEWGEGI